MDHAKAWHDTHRGAARSNVSKRGADGAHRDLWSFQSFFWHDASQ